MDPLPSMFLTCSYLFPEALAPSVCDTYEATPTKQHLRSDPRKEPVGQPVTHRTIGDTYKSTYQKDRSVIRGTFGDTYEATHQMNRLVNRSPTGPSVTPTNQPIKGTSQPVTSEICGDACKATWTHQRNGQSAVTGGSGGLTWWAH